MTRSEFRAEQALSNGVKASPFVQSAYDRVGRNALIYTPRIETRKPTPTIGQRIARAIIKAL